MTKASTIKTLTTTAMAIAGAALFTVAPTSAQDTVGSDNNFVATPIYSSECITEQDVVDAQIAWGNGIVRIGRIFSEGGDYRTAAAEHINQFYAYDLSLVLFKPTLAADEQFRSSFDGALSYFVGGNPSYPEDGGFAIKPWTAVRWQNAGIVNNSCNMAVAMGNYFFTPADGSPEVKVEYTLGYVRDAEGDLRILVHQSSLPYAGS